MIRLTWILAVFVPATLLGHFGYLHFVAAPAPAAAPTGVHPELIWLQRELDLTPSQLAAARALHEECWPRVARLRAELDAERRAAEATGNRATCLAVAGQCKSYTVTFIEQMTTVLTPAQRQKYLSLVGSCLPPAARTEGAKVEQSPGR